jgi:hypothetical protein
VAERSEAGWGVAQRIVDQRQHAVQIPIDFIVPETQYPEALDDKVMVPPRITPGMCIEVMLTAVDLDDEAVFETDEIYDISIAWGLAAEVKSLISP